MVRGQQGLFKTLAASGYKLDMSENSTKHLSHGLYAHRNAGRHRRHHYRIGFIVSAALEKFEMRTSSNALTPHPFNAQISFRFFILAPKKDGTHSQ